MAGFQIGFLVGFLFMSQRRDLSPQSTQTNLAIKASTFSAASARREADLEQELERARWEIEQLNEIGIALSTQRDRDSLLRIILQKCREITASDAGSLYLVEEDERGERRLRFKITQNDSTAVEFRESLLPIDSSSLAGYVALTGEAIDLPTSTLFRLRCRFISISKFDEQSGYRSKSMLIVPIKNPQGEIIGVVQLINCKRAHGARVDNERDERFVPYPAHCRPLLDSLASQAAVAIENNRLDESIETLFEGFVRASVGAIESRDPATSGHSFRVADLTIGLARRWIGLTAESFRDIRFSRAEMKEIRYASLLHDFGKVGVREEVLVKAKKLYPLQLELVKQRFAYARKAMEHEQSERKLAYLLERGREEFLLRQNDFQRELEDNLREIDDFLGFIVKCNEPTVLRDGNFKRLPRSRRATTSIVKGRRKPLLTLQEVALLSIRRAT